MNGCPLTSCDLTSPDATTLVRQYQSAVFTPIMRVHEMQVRGEERERERERDGVERESLKCVLCE